MFNQQRLRGGGGRPASLSPALSEVYSSEHRRQFEASCNRCSVCQAPSEAGRVALWAHVWDPSLLGIADLVCPRHVAPYLTRRNYTVKFVPVKL